MRGGISNKIKSCRTNERFDYDELGTIIVNIIYIVFRIIQKLRLNKCSIQKSFRSRKQKCVRLNQMSENVIPQKDL